MKKQTILLIWGILFTPFIFAQNNSMFVSLKGGQKLIFNNLGYNYYHFQHLTGQCDTLICSNPGYETASISKNYIKFDSEHKLEYKIFNTAIQKTIRYIRKHQLESGEIKETIHKRKVLIQFNNGTQDGEGVFLIKIIE
jgi:hypothetical protein